MARALRAQARRPGWWWGWAAFTAAAGLIVGLIPVRLTESACGTPLLPTGTCDDRLTVRLGISMALLGLALILLAVGLARSDLGAGRGALCLIGVVALAGCSYLVLRALTLEGAAPAHCNMVLTRSRNDRIWSGAACGRFWSEQWRRTLIALGGAVASIGVILLATRLGRRHRGVAPFVASPA